ncbi:protein MAIN-LIKE 1-like [Papaver somniferum]|uniref:protein MAIN-LIKE 1-like n=1 Tax=Papaver somniferum TaxID=3469 RepID=UPI000E704AAC|nr:protein MAIN-LIKE 1-like [Papaver somniferum]
MTEEKTKHHVIAYFLYQLGTIFFPDTSGHVVNAHYLQLLDPLDEVNNYSWGIAVLSFVQVELRKASRLRSLYFGGLYTLVQVWVYDHFPKLQLSNARTPWPFGKPTAGKYEFLNSHEQNKGKKVLELRETLDKLTVEDVVFHPYSIASDEDEEDIDVIDFSPVAGYNEPLFHHGGCTMYNPRRVLRQLSCVQSVPQVENFKVKKAGTKNSEKNFIPKYDPAPSVDHWKNFGDYLVPFEELQDSFDEPNATDDGYMEWYEHFSHPRVINNVQQARADKAKATVMEKEAQKIMKPTPMCGDEALILWNSAIRYLLLFLFFIFLSLDSPF